MESESHVSSREAETLVGGLCAVQMNSGGGPDSRGVAGGRVGAPGNTAEVDLTYW